ncbi:thioredoxin family protein [Lutimonas sp.]|uniref:thioredoxin family protein n=1 Tax=Lutimonas sp. TaxID=1872403 RepID=UPI003D9B6B60
MEINYEKIIEENRGVLLYFATNSCSVGEALEPKVRTLMSAKFPKIVFHFVDMNLLPEFSASKEVFVEPTVLVFIDGKEYLRKSRHIGVGELDAAIERLYALAFEE